MNISKKLMVTLSLSLVLTGIVAASASAMTIWSGTLKAYNPAYSNPYAEMHVLGGGTNVYISTTAAKSGYATNTVSNTWKSSIGDLYTTAYGPTFAASGTSFTGSDSGTDSNGTYHSETAGPINY